MPFQPLTVYDRMGGGTLHAQLLNSLGAGGTFQIDNASALGTQLASMPAGSQGGVFTTELEQILATFTVSGSTVTCTIVTRGYNGTSAATHALGAAVEMHWTKAHNDVVNSYLSALDGTYLKNRVINYDGVTPTITNATTLSVAASDESSRFTLGARFVFQVSSVWYVATVTAVAFSTNTTITITGDGLPASGTITALFFEMGVSTKGVKDYELLREATNLPATPPSGYEVLFLRSGGGFGLKDSSGNVRWLTTVVKAVSSASGVITCDCSQANFFEITLTENITQIVVSNPVDGQDYHLQVRQHASSAKTISQSAFVFNSTISGWTMTTTVNKVDIVAWRHSSGTGIDNVVGLVQALTY